MSAATGAGGAGKAMLPHEASRLTSVQRDQGLQLFHALGKLLYNKRDGSDEDGGGSVGTGGSGAEGKGGKPLGNAAGGGGGKSSSSIRRVAVNSALGNGVGRRGGGQRTAMAGVLPSFGATDHLLDPR